MDTQFHENGHSKLALPVHAIQLSENVLWSKTGLKFDNRIQFKEWYAVGEQLKFFESSIQFALGDWLNYGESRIDWGEKYSQALDASEYEYDSLKQFAWVADKVELCTRVHNLSYSHHREVASLKTPNGTPDAEQQRHYLELAVREGLSVSRLKAQIKADKIAQHLAEQVQLAQELGEKIDNQPQIKFPEVIEAAMESILPSWSGEKFDLIIADPPYNVTDLEWDTFDAPEFFIEQTRLWLIACMNVCKPQFNLFWFCSPHWIADVEMVIRSLALPIQSRIVWNRRNMSLGSAARNKFIDTYEMIFHVGNRELNFPPEWSDSWFDVQTFAAPQTNFEDVKLHPTQKPLGLLRRLVAYGSYPGDTILDPFAGSGTTGHACMLEPGRRCILIEQEIEYVNTIRQRLGISSQQTQNTGSPVTA